VVEAFKRRYGISLLTTAQRQFKDLLRQARSVKPSRKARLPRNDLERFCYYCVITKRKAFNNFGLFVIVLNICKYLIVC
jgi:voltage-dependent calcium channel